MIWHELEKMFSNKCIYLFLPHQDDEIALWPIWSNILKASSIYIFYTTNGEQSFQSNAEVRKVRNSEAISAMTRNGIKKENIFFLSQELPGTDQLLHYYANEILQNISFETKKLIEPNIILFPSNEGGHPDHDVTNLIVRLFGQTLNRMPNAYEYCLYSLSNRPFRFNIAHPEVLTPNTIQIKFPRIKIFNVIKLMLNYNSQRKTFLLLGPCLIIQWLKNPVIFLDEVNMKMIDFVHPVNKHVLYEKRKWTTFKEIRKKLIQTKFIIKH